jgi:Tfp pilus assembly protein PilN
MVVNGGAILVYPFLRDSINSTNAQLSSVLKSISEISKPAEDATKLGQDLQNLKGLLSKIKEVESSINVNPPYSVVLKEFKSLSPGGVSISDIALKDDSSISLRGNSNTMRNVFNFEENLSKATYIYNATVLSVDRDTNEFTFEMQANMRKGK